MADRQRSAQAVGAKCRQTIAPPAGRSRLRLTTPLRRRRVHGAAARRGDWAVRRCSAPGHGLGPRDPQRGAAGDRVYLLAESIHLAVEGRCLSGWREGRAQRSKVGANPPPNVGYGRPLGWQGHRRAHHSRVVRKPTVDELRIREAGPTGHDATVKIRVQCIGPDGKLEIQQYQLLLADFISAKSPFRNRSRTPGEASGLRLRQARSNARPAMVPNG
jgi:hypothetical protein